MDIDAGEEKDIATCPSESVLEAEADDEILSGDEESDSDFEIEHEKHLNSWTAK